MAELSSDEEVRAVYEQRLKWKLDRNSEMHGAILGAKEEVAKKMKAYGDPIEKIQTITGLSPEIIIKL